MDAQVFFSFKFFKHPKPWQLWIGWQEEKDTVFSFQRASELSGCKWNEPRKGVYVSII